MDAEIAGTMTFQGEVWLYVAPKASWHFVTVPKESSERIRFFAPQTGRGWGSVRVAVTIGSSNWQTSVFPDKKTGCYFLPIKKVVRDAEQITEGSIIRCEISIASV